ncbi:uncharacterized protein LOC126762385 [Bactrocera neohumeralis]|uniref:uncharacterized protein LOC126762385 n=1 Tax=Bactrocera neohumeralis TaxID=98809 RepID=UPI0021659A02|nr:uncharacterized protein LOC126762385 [Bactrocera neohumeralis]
MYMYKEKKKVHFQKTNWILKRQFGAFLDHHIEDYKSIQKRTLISAGRTAYSLFSYPHKNHHPHYCAAFRMLKRFQKHKYSKFPHKFAMCESKPPNAKSIMFVERNLQLLY